MLKAINCQVVYLINLANVKKFLNVKKDTMKLTSSAASVELECYYCRQNHPIYRCQMFNKFSVSNLLKHISEIKQLNIVYTCTKTINVKVDVVQWCT